MELAIDPQKARAIRNAKNKSTDEYCSMCGDYCAVKIIGEYLDDKKKKNTEVHWEKANKHPTPFPQDIKKGLLNTSCSASLFHRKVRSGQ